MVTVGEVLLIVIVMVWLYARMKLRRLIRNFIIKAVEVITMYNTILEKMKDDTLEVDDLLWQGDFYSILVKKDDYEVFIKKIREYIGDVQETYKKLPQKSCYYRTNYLGIHLYDIICNTKDEIDKLLLKLERE